MPNLRFGNDAEPALRVRHQVIQVQEREGGGAANGGAGRVVHRAAQHPRLRNHRYMRAGCVESGMRAWLMSMTRNHGWTRG
jgi:hypothetical protein